MVGSPFHVAATSREARHGSPFASRCRDVKVGNPVAKSIYITAATFCDVWVDDEVAVCWPSLETIRVSTEWGRTAFMEGWRFLIRRVKRQAVPARLY